MDTLFIKRWKPLSFALLIVLLIVIFSSCTRIYPFEKSARWVSSDPYFVLEYRYVNGKFSEQNSFLEINGEFQEVEVGHQGGIFGVFLKTTEIDNYDEMLFRGTWRYRGDKLVYYIEDDFVFDGAYKEIVFDPEEITEQDTQPE